jgi:hypothetical protein
MSRVAELIKQHSDDRLADMEGHVTQIWEDGEITMQKSGHLLDRRTLHCMKPGFDDVAAPLSIFPHKNKHKHAWAYVTAEAAQTIRMAIWEEYGCVAASENEA